MNMKIYYTDFNKSIQFKYKEKYPIQLTNSIIVIADFGKSERSGTRLGESCVEPVEPPKSKTVEGDKRLRFKIPHCFKSDGCSIPFPFWGIIGHPLTGKYIPASVIHDYILANPKIVNRNLKLSTDIFYAVLLNEGVNKLTADIMRFFVYWYQRIIRRSKWVGK